MFSSILINFIVLNAVFFPSEHYGNSSKVVIVTWILGQRVIPEMMPGQRVLSLISKGNNRVSVENWIKVMARKAASQWGKTAQK